MLTFLLPSFPPSPAGPHWLNLAGGWRAREPTGVIHRGQLAAIVERREQVEEGRAANRRPPAYQSGRVSRLTRCGCKMDGSWDLRGTEMEIFYFKIQPRLHQSWLRSNHFSRLIKTENG